jgi:hypothetical protein
MNAKGARSKRALTQRTRRFAKEKQSTNSDRGIAHQAIHNKKFVSPVIIVSGVL